MNATHGARSINQIELDEQFPHGPKLLGGGPEERLNEFGIPNGKIYPPEMLVDPRFQAGQHRARRPPEFGNIAMQNVTPRLSESRGACAIQGRRSANITPMYGELSQKIY